MKPTELMIGDWVLSYPEKGRVDGIICLREEHTADGKWMAIVHLGGNKYEQVNIGILEPIPLTTEILEKNGFVYADLPFEDFYEGYGLHIHGGNYADGHSNWYIICGINVSMNVTHVHELQHALRLCGIDKDVVL